jgi:hypothetical protein
MSVYGTSDSEIAADLDLALFTCDGRIEFCRKVRPVGLESFLSVLALVSKSD